MPSNIKLLWPNILNQAKNLGIPLTQKRAIIREYLQTQFLAQIYSKKESRILSFIGGTSLRILRGLNRFSEDLDFDNLGIPQEKLKEIFSSAAVYLEKQGFRIEYFYENFRDGTGRGKLKFIGLLEEFDISKHSQEKLQIYFQHAKPAWKTETEVILMAQFGALAHVVTNTPETLLAQKILALILRKRTKARDIFDITWLLSQNVKPNYETLEYADLGKPQKLQAKMKAEYAKIKPQLPLLKKEIQPLLLEPKDAEKLNFFGDLIEQI